MELPYIYNKENRPFINKSKEVMNIKVVIDNLNNKINSLGHKRRKSKSFMQKFKEKKEINTSKNEKSMNQEPKIFKKTDAFFKGNLFPRDLNRNYVEEKLEIYKKNKMLKTPASLFDIHVMKEVPDENVIE